MNRTSTVLIFSLFFSLFFDHQIAKWVATIPHTSGFDSVTKLTDLGRAWVYFFFSGLSLVLLTLIALYRPDLRLRLRPWVSLAGMSLSAFCVTGLLEMILKMLIGRARPEETVNFDNLVFEPFSFNHVFHSFPSGHSQTVFTFAFLIGRRWPKARPFVFFYAAFIASTRVLRNSHYLSDVIGGILLAWFGVQIVRWYFNRTFCAAALGTYEISGSLSEAG